MLNRFTTQNGYVTTIIEKVLPISTGDPLEEFSFTVSEAPVDQEGFCVIDFTKENKKDLIRFHRVEGTTIFYYRKDRDLLQVGAADVTHDKGAFVRMNVFSEYLNYIMQNTNDFGQIEDFGTNKIRVYGGIIHFNNQDVNVPDQTITLGNGTKHIVYNYVSEVFEAVDDFGTIVGMKVGEVVVASGEKVSITDKRTFHGHIIFDDTVFTFGDDGLVKSISGGAISPATEASLGTTRLGALSTHGTDNSYVVQVKNLLQAPSGTPEDDEKKIPILDSEGTLNSFIQFVTAGEGEEGYVQLATLAEHATNVSKAVQAKNLIVSPSVDPTDDEDFVPVLDITGKLNNGFLNIGELDDHGTEGKPVDTGSVTGTPDITPANDAKKIPMLSANGQLDTGFVPLKTWLFGDGSDGVLEVLTGTVTLDLDRVYNYSSIKIASGATVNFNASASDVAAMIKCSGLATINGTITTVGAITGYKATRTSLESLIFNSLPSVGLSGAGGSGGIDGRGRGGDGGDANADFGDLSGDGSNGSTGGAGGTGGIDRDTSTTTSGDVTGGAAGTYPSGDGGDGSVSAGDRQGAGGGGGAGGAPGDNGASILLYFKEFTGSGSIISSGGVGGPGGAGGNGASGLDSADRGYGGAGGAGGAGGGGGAILTVYEKKTYTGTIVSTGGAGGTGGSGGLGSRQGSLNVGYNGPNGVAGGVGNDGVLKEVLLYNVI